MTAFYGHAQTLTVDKIMQDPKWIGTSPGNAFWGPDSKTVYFNWNPQNNVADSVYAFSIGEQLRRKRAFMKAKESTP
ncbi:MAG: hypothetical protein PHD73_13180 [Sediminibacterium sp.]|nr:hypothetical protein [Sediminibacterium sp.]